MADPQSLEGQVVSGNEESEQNDSRLKGSDLLVQRMWITYRKKRYTSIRNYMF
jgi:hypothetical protein